MSITDELRRWAKVFENVWFKHASKEVVITTGGSMSIDHVNMRLFIEGIADRIDAEHNRMVGCTADEWDYWESTHIELPKDADGEYIHVGDVMNSKVDYLFDGKPFKVCALVLCEDGWEASDGRFGNRYEPDSLRHYHELTVEDVLMEFHEKAKDILSDYVSTSMTIEERMDAESSLIADYAKRLRLATEVDE